MHYDIHYSGNDTAEDRKQAIEDIIEYMGAERFAHCTRELELVQDMTAERFTLLASFAGISGYPVRVWFDHCYGPGSWGEGVKDDGEAGASNLDEGEGE